MPKPRPLSPGWLEQQAARTPLLFLVLAALLWSTGGVLIKSVTLSGAAIAGWRSLFAALFLLAVSRRLRPKADVYHWLGALAYALNINCLVLATTRTTAANAIFLQYSAPIYVALLGPWLLKEHLRRSDLPILILALSGLILLFRDQLGPGALSGNLLGLAAGVSFAFTILLLRRQRDADPVGIVLWGNLLATLFSLPWMLQQWPVGQDLALLLLLGVVQLGIAYWFYVAAIRHTPALPAVLTATLEPVCNPIWVALVLGEVPGWAGWTGGSIVVLSVILKALTGRTQSSST